MHDGGSCHIETSPLICRANQWTCIYMIETFVMKELNHFKLVSEAYVGHCQTSLMKLFRKNSYHLIAAKYFCKKLHYGCLAGSQIPLCFLIFHKTGQRIKINLNISQKNQRIFQDFASTVKSVKLWFLHYIRRYWRKRI